MKGSSLLIVSTLGIIGLLAACGGKGGGPSKPILPPDEASTAGRLGVLFYVRANQLYGEPLEQAVSKASAMGVGWLRYHCEWDYSGASDYLGRQQAYRSLVKAAGARLILHISVDRRQTHPGAWPTTPTAKAEFAQFAADRIQECREDFALDDAVFQIGNEVTQEDEWKTAEGRQHYADLFALLNVELKKRGVTARISPAAFNNQYGKISSAAWMSWLDSFGVSSQVQAITINSYKGHEINLPEDTAASVREFADWAGAKPVYVTEMGFPTKAADSAYGWTEDDHQSMVLRSVLSALSSPAKAVVLYELRDRQGWCNGALSGCVAIRDYPNGSVHEEYFGLYRQDLSAKPAATLMAKFLNELGAFNPGAIASVGGGRWQMTFSHSDGRTALVKWSQSRAAATAEHPFVPVWTISPASA